MFVSNGYPDAIASVSVNDRSWKIIMRTLVRRSSATCAMHSSACMIIIVSEHGLQTEEVFVNRNVSSLVTHRR